MHDSPPPDVAGDTVQHGKFEDVNVIVDNEDPENLKYKGEHLVPVLVNAVKELSAKVEALESKLNN